MRVGDVRAEAFARQPGFMQFGGQRLDFFEADAAGVAFADPRDRSRQQALHDLRRLGQQGSGVAGAAFDAGDRDKAEELANEITSEGAARSKLKIALGDLETSLQFVQDKGGRDRLEAVLAIRK